VALQAHLSHLRATQTGLPAITEEVAIRDAFRAFRTVFARHQRTVFQHERKQWFQNADERLRDVIFCYILLVQGLKLFSALTSPRLRHMP
jgi:hypothetical protein